MADCGEYSHQAIELNGLFDIKDAQLLRAEIDVIDRINNQAEITLLDTCELVSWIDLDNVPFFYHCEDSSGTLEDLALGNQAFVVGDMVYVIAIPAVGEVEAQVYIVGHVDIKGTKFCGTPEYLVITLAFYHNTISYSFVTVFDALTGAKIDLSSFENLDGSPAKPTSLPAATADISSWLAYNFEAPTGVNGILGSINITGASGSTYYKDASGDYESWLYDGIDDDVAYTGQSYALCTSFSTGNATYQDNYSNIYTGNNNSNQQVDYSYTTTHERTGVTKYELGDTYCRAYWLSVSLTANLAHTEDRHLCGQLVSGGTTHYFWWEADSQISHSVQVTNSGDTTEIEASIYNYSYSFSHDDAIFSDTFPYLELRKARSWSSSVTGTLSVPPVFDSTVREINRISYFSSTDALGKFPDISPAITPPGSFVSKETWRLIPWQVTMSSGSNCFKSGEQYAYLLIGFLSVECWYTSTDHAETTYQGIGGSGNVWPGVVTGEVTNSIGLERRWELITTPNTFVAKMTDMEEVSDPPFTYVNLHECFTASNTIKASGLNAVIVELFDRTIDAYYTNNSIDNYNDVGYLISYLKNGPSAVVRRKKSE